MSDFPEHLPHGEIEEIFPDVFFVSGAMQGMFGGSLWQFSRNMTIVREGDALTIVNSVRLDDDGLAALEKLGTVRNVVRLGSLHGRDDAFYVHRYGADYWALPGMPPVDGLTPTRELSADGDLPLAGCTLFTFQETKLPEAILRLDREGGILLACDALQNWVEPDRFFLDETRETMTGMGFFQPANLGPVWVQMNEPKPGDFVRLKELPYRHVLCGHGSPLRDCARDSFHATFARVFDI